MTLRTRWPRLSYEEELAVAGTTAELQVDLGASLELEPNEAAKQEKLLKEAIKSKNPRTSDQREHGLCGRCLPENLRPAAGP
jgi:hypothetical protein